MGKIKEQLKNGVIAVAPNLYFYQLYLRYRHRWPHFDNPKDLSEIVMSDVMNHRIEQYAPYADKVEVRKYIEEWGLGEYLPKLYGVWDSVDDIDYDSLPDKFALKTNHGCGDHQFCHGKATFDFAKAKEAIRPVLAQTYGGRLEPHYALIQSKVFAEELLEQPGEAQPVDFKFMCCDGEVRFILYAVERGSATGVKFNAYSLDWKKLDYMCGPEASKKDFKSPPPHILKKMIDIAQLIAEKFEHVRVDLYAIGDKIYIGELTFTPEGGIMSYFNNKAVEAAGHLK